MHVGGFDLWLSHFKSRSEKAVPLGSVVWTAARNSASKSSINFLNRNLNYVSACRAIKWLTLLRWHVEMNLLIPNWAIYFLFRSGIQLTPVADSNLSRCQIRWLRKYFITWRRLLNSYVVWICSCEFGYSQRKLSTPLGGFLNSWSRRACGQIFAECHQRLMGPLGWWKKKVTEL